MAAAGVGGAERQGDSGIRGTGVGRAERQGDSGIRGTFCVQDGSGGVGPGYSRARESSRELGGKWSKAPHPQAT